MRKDQNVFVESLRFIRSETNLDALDCNTLEFLRRADYSGEGKQHKSNSSQKDENRVALLKLASKICDVVDHVPYYAPNVYLFRGTVDLDRLGLDRINGGRSGVGGRGANFRVAFESCIGEAAEYISLNQDISERSSPSFTADYFDECTGKWIAAGLGLNTVSDLNEMPLIEAKPVLAGSSVYVPTEFIVRSKKKSTKLKREAESTGLAAAPTHQEATYRALREVIERDSYALWWFGRRWAKSVSPDVIAVSKLADAIRKRRNGTEQPRKLWFLDITSELNVPVFVAVSCENDGGSVGVGLGCDLDPIVALTRAYFELAQMEEAMRFSLNSDRDEKSEHEMNSKDRLWQSRQQHLNAYVQKQFRTVIGETELFTKTDPDVRTKSLTTRLYEQNYTPFCVDLTIEEIGIPVVRVFVPGLQSPKPDWISDRLARQILKSGVPRSVALAGVAPL